MRAAEAREAAVLAVGRQEEADAADDGRSQWASCAAAQPQQTGARKRAHELGHRACCACGAFGPARGARSTDAIGAALLQNSVLLAAALRTTLVDDFRELQSRFRITAVGL